VTVLADWKKQLYNEMMKRKKQGITGTEGLKELFEDISTTYNLAFSTVKVNYYKLKKEVEETIIEKEEVSTAKTYQVGDLIELVVTGIANYGVFAVSNDEMKHSGLIHVSEVRDFYIPDLHRYFKMGEIITARIKSIDENGKFSFSTKDLPLSDYTEEKVEASQEEPKELNEVLKYMEHHVGMVSPQAKEKVQELIQKHGMFKFSMAISQTVPHFQNDLGLLLVKEIEKNMKDCL